MWRRKQSWKNPGLPGYSPSLLAVDLESGVPNSLELADTVPRSIIEVQPSLTIGYRTTRDNPPARPGTKVAMKNPPTVPHCEPLLAPSDRMIGEPCRPKSDILVVQASDRYLVRERTQSSQLGRLLRMETRSGPTRVIVTFGGEATRLIGANRES